MDWIRVRTLLSSTAVWIVLAALFCLTVAVDLYVLAPQGSAISFYFANRPGLLRFMTYSFCVFVMLIIPHCIVSDTPVKNKVGWLLLFFFTAGYATEVYFVVRTITGWGASGEPQPKK
jgi:hypothetical protein